MRAYEATYSHKGADTTRLVGANTLAGAARKAEEAADLEKTGELIKIELTDKVIL